MKKIFKFLPGTGYMILELTVDKYNFNCFGNKHYINIKVISDLFFSDHNVGKT